MFWTVITLVCLAGKHVFGADDIYVNRYRPEFTSKKYFAEIPENTNVGSSVIRVEAQDGDVGASIAYSIERGNEEDAFEIDPESGIIKTRKKLDYEKKSKYVLRIKANDGFYNAKSFVEIRISSVEDENPLFKNSYLQTGSPEKSSSHRVD